LRQMREKTVAVATDNLVVSATGEIITQNLKTVADFVQAGSIVWRRTVDSIFLMSRILDLAHDRLSRDDYQDLVTKLHMSDSSASQLRKITVNPRLVQLADSGATLPASTHTLYLLSSMNDEDFKAFTSAHDLDADVRTEDVRKFLQER
ncbi:hypothetical protein, partial [Klebsiella pneumoniae]|uniref:hypothetical protein n=1 Tax=Klebsiella pneumoniae TaxID=573 RepID=UPI003FD11C4F